MTECMVRILIAGDSNQLSQLPASELPDCAGIVVNYNYPRGGGGHWVFFGWVCAARESKLAPCSKKNFP